MIGMNMKKIFFRNSLVFFSLIVLSLVVSACQPSIQKQCSVDSDCVPAACCHPTEAVNSAYAPNCAAVLCTAECAPGTLDCGQGEIKCVKSQCTVSMNSQ